MAKAKKAPASETPAQQVSRLVDELGHDMARGDWMRFLDEVTTDCQFKLEAAREDDEDDEDMR